MNLPATHCHLCQPRKNLRSNVPQLCHMGQSAFETAQVCCNDEITVSPWGTDFTPWAIAQVQPTKVVSFSVAAVEAALPDQQGDTALPHALRNAKSIPWESGKAIASKDKASKHALLFTTSAWKFQSICPAAPPGAGIPDPVRVTSSILCPGLMFKPAAFLGWTPSVEIKRTSNSSSTVHWAAQNS